MIVRTLLLVFLAAAHLAQGASLTYRGCVPLEGKQAAGLSGIAFAGEQSYWGVTDAQPTLLKLQIDVARDATVKSAKVEAVVPILHGRDYEGIARSPDGRVWLSNEDPGVFEVTPANGRITATLKVPEIFKQLVRNQGFESLTCSPDGKTLWTANERALIPDGNPQLAATPILSATQIRLLRYDITPNGVTPVAQYTYETSGVHDWGGQIGLCDLVALPDGRLLALERSGAQNFQGVKSIRSRIFLVDVTDATDISKPPFDAGLVGREPVKVRKSLLFDGFVCNERGSNLEGLCLGPKLGVDRWTVVGVIDSTDGPLGLSTPAVVGFELDLSQPPASGPATGRSGKPE